MSLQMPRKVALMLEYDGTQYAGFQVQANALTIQGELERAIARLTLAEARVHGAGRTDQGVHAQGQVAAFSTGSALPCTALVSGLNHFLPADIAVQAAYNVPSGFDPRRHALSRVYQYAFLNRAVPSPLMERRACRVAAPLDDEAMAVSLRLLIGRHDFAPLSGALAAGKSTVRSIYAARLWREVELVRFEVEANAFLPHQMRRIAGLLLAVGSGHLSPEGVWGILDGHSNLRAMEKLATAPPQGLCLMQVKYEDFPPYAY